MRVIKSGKVNKPLEAETECRCGCVFRFHSTEGRAITDRDGSAVIARCPECGRENWVATSEFR